MNILLIGGAGFIGINMALSLIKENYNVIIADMHIDNLRINQIFQDALTGVEKCRLSVELISSLIQRYDINLIVNLSSRMIPASGYDSMISELEDIVVPGVKILEKIADFGVKYICISSGGAIYGDYKNKLLSEEDVLRPISYYGYSKLIQEEHVKLVHRIKGLDYLIIRPSNPYGPYQNPAKLQGIIPIFTKKILYGESVEIWGDGSIIRDFITVEDLSDAVTQLIKNNIWNQTYNIGSGNGVSIKEVVRLIENMANTKAKILYKGARECDVRSIVLDIDKIKRAINFNPMKLENGIGEYLLKGKFNALQQ